MMLTTWNIHSSDGQYVGQARAFHPKVALSVYLDIPVHDLEMNEMTSTEDADRDYDLNYNGKDFVLRRKPVGNGD